ncbi:hypothetical protein ACFWVF_35855 [Streptomyces sp. NPDC058659]|uniref:hypothetical protein n=1 Tax=unclassified Streptomyces TaxID=2593676 RepID=UPI003666768E
MVTTSRGGWFASVAVLDEEGYEIVCRDAARNGHEVTTAAGVHGCARGLTIWRAARDLPRRPTGQVSEFKNTV